MKISGGDKNLGWQKTKGDKKIDEKLRPKKICALAIFRQMQISIEMSFWPEIKYNLPGRIKRLYSRKEHAIFTVTEKTSIYSLNGFSISS